MVFYSFKIVVAGAKQTAMDVDTDEGGATHREAVEIPQQTHNVNTTLYNVVILQRCENYIPATLLQRKLQRCATTCTQHCEITL